MTGFAIIRLIAGKRNCSYSPFLSGKSLFVNFCLVKKDQNYDSCTIYLHSYNRGRALYRLEIRRNLPRSPEHTAMTRSVAMPSNLGMLSSGKFLPQFYYGSLFSSLTASKCQLLKTFPPL